MALLNDVTFLYVKIKQAVKNFNEDGFEWTVDCVISEKDAKAWKAKFKKQPPKSYTNKKFKETFKIDPPFPKQEEQFVVKLKKDTHYKDKQSGEIVKLDPKFAPKVLKNIGINPKTGKVINQDITRTTLVANGSTGIAQYDIVSNKFGDFAKLKAIRVDNLIEYSNGMEELGEIQEGDVEEDDPSLSGDDDDMGEESGGEEPPFEPDSDDDTEY